MLQVFNTCYKRVAFIICFLFAVNSFSQSPDFKVQHLQNDVPRTGSTSNSFTAVSSLNSTIEFANNNRKTHAGRSDLNSGNLNGYDMAGARRLTGLGTLSYYREGASTASDMRFNTSLWEYIGPSGGNNEIIVRGRYIITLNGGANSLTQAVAGVINANKCIPFITGIMNSDSSSGADSGTAIAYLENSTTLRVQKGTSSNNVSVYITLVEFTGSNWTVLHADSGNTDLDSGSLTLRNGSAGTGTATNVSSWSDAIIFGHFRADTASSGTNENLSDLWPVLTPGSNNQTVDWNFHGDHDSNGTNRHFVHVLVNSGLNVTRYQNTNSSDSESTINISSASLTNLNQSLIIGSSTSSGNGTAYGRSWRNYYLNSITEAAHWAHRSGNTMAHEIQIIDLSGLTSIPIGPEINVIGLGININSGTTAISSTNNTDFGNVFVGSGSVVHTFTIQNLGSSNLSLTNPSPFILLTGNTADFILSTIPSSSISVSGTSTFAITFNPTVIGTRSATISIANNDITGGENPYTFNISGFGTDYCNSNGNNSDSYLTGIRQVSFNTIVNATPIEDNDYSDFTSLTTNVMQGNSYNLTVNVNTDGDYRVHVFTWIDWNQDGDFNDSGEAYDLGDIRDVVNGSLSTSILVPLTASIGSTRMRVSTKWNNDPTSCETGFDGEVEDYTINVQLNNTISTGTISPTSYCTGSTVSVPYTISGTYNTGNFFTAQLSNASGSFASPTDIGTINSTIAGTISATIPVGTIAGTGYRVRVISSNPSVTGTINGVNLTINSTPTTPTTTGAQICIGSTATLSASGAVLGDRYRWYSAATAGTLLYTSTNNTDNTYTTPTISATTNYWVSILNSGGCESSRTMVTATYPTNSPDSQTTLGTDSWIGHVYDGTNSGVAFNGSFTNYYGNVTQSETFDETFGGNTTCFALNSTLGSRSIFTETFSVRYRMNSTKKGFYVVDLGSDDGSRLQVDGTLVYNNWSDQGFSTRSGVLMSLNGNSSLVYDFYENGGGNRVIFNNLIKVLDNTLSTNTIQSICNTATGAAISGDTFGALPTGISLSGTGYQWAYSTSVTGPWTNISGATSATFAPSGSTPEFSAGGTFYVIRKAILSSANNVNPNPYVATNNSNVATITIISNNSWSGAVSADWNNAANWSCGAVPTITTDVIIPFGTLHDPIIYISPDANGLVKNIELQSGATLTIQDNYIEIAGTLLLNGVIDLVGEGQLIQTTGSLLDNSSTGYIERDQQGQGSRFRYNDWSSPVIKTGTSLGTPFSIADVLRDGTVSSTPGPIIYTSGYDGATSPFTLSEFWMYKYANAPDGSYSDWDKIGSTGTLSPGEGFLMKGTGNPGSPDQNYVFVGKPNNGAISFTVNPNYDYLVGNPYPSAIDLNKFIDDNTPSGTGSSITGSIYFWDHYGGTTHNLADYQAGYGIYTKGGGVKASAHSSVSGTGTSVKVPTRYLPIGQGFFVVGDSDGGAIQFNNNQRIFVTETSGNSIFMKGAINKSSEVLKVSADDLRPKFRLGFTGPKIDHRQILLTLDPDTTDGLDWGFEAEPYEIFEDDMYWIISDKKYVIQATNSINIDKEIPLGIKTAGGLIKIEIDLLENVNPSTNLYIKDNSTGQTFDIKQQDFEITLPAGEYNSRFSLVFKAQNTLAVEDEILNEGIIVFMNNASSELVIRKSISNAIESVQLFNRLGQLIKTWNNSFKGEEFNLPINESTGLYFVKINTDIGKINKKIIIE